MDTSPKATEEKIAMICDELAARGIRPTQDSVRAQCSGGSATTVTKYMDRWFTGFVKRVTGELGRVTPPIRSPEELEIEVMLRHVMQKAKVAASISATDEFRLAKQYLEKQLELAHEARRRAVSEQEFAAQQVHGLETALSETEKRRLVLEGQLRDAQQSIAALEASLRERAALHEADQNRWASEAAKSREDTHAALQTLTERFSELKSEFNSFQTTSRPDGGSTDHNG